MPSDLPPTEEKSAKDQARRSKLAAMATKRRDSDYCARRVTITLAIITDDGTYRFNINGGTWDTRATAKLVKRILRTALDAAGVPGRKSHHPLTPEEKPENWPEYVKAMAAVFRSGDRSIWHDFLRANIDKDFGRFGLSSQYVSASNECDHSANVPEYIRLIQPLVRDVSSVSSSSSSAGGAYAVATSAPVRALPLEDLPQHVLADVLPEGGTALTFSSSHIFRTSAASAVTSSADSSRVLPFDDFSPDVLAEMLFHVGDHTLTSGARASSSSAASSFAEPKRPRNTLGL